MSENAVERWEPATLADLEAALLRLDAEGGDGNGVVLQQGPAWLAFSGTRGSGTVQCVAVSRKQLPADATVALEDVLHLRRAGFSNVPGRPGLARDYGIRAPGAASAASAAALDLLGRVYRRPESESVSVELHLRDRPRTTNPALLDAMRATARTRDGATRNALYRSMLRASFLVPMDGDAPRIVGEISGWDSYAAFTDAEHLQRWAGRPVDCRVIKGRALFPMLMRVRTGSLLVNPGGAVGGELYRNEVEAIAAAVR